jgi:hypothetical protein
MAMIDQARVNSILASILNNAAWAAVGTPGTPTYIKLGTTTPTNTANMTELTGTGYVANGTAITWPAPASGQVTGPVTAITWTNSSGGNWNITGLEIWNTGGTGTRWFYGNWTGFPVVVANGNSFQVAANAITINASGW